MNNQDQSFTIEELSAQATVPIRTIRYYITEGLLPGPTGRGKNAAYTPEHAARLRLIRELVEQRVPLSEIRERISGLSSGEVRSLLAQERRNAARLRIAESASTPREYLSALLEQARAAKEPQSSGTVRESQPSFCTARPVRPQAERWTRYELAPGIELNIESAAEKKYRSLIKRIIEMVEEQGLDQ